MARNNRDRDPDIYHHIYSKTLDSLLTLVDYETVAPLVAGILARYQVIFAIRIYAYTFLGNHFHLLIDAPLGNADEFMENVMREISKRVNKLYDRKGTFWSKRYQDEPIEDEVGAVNCLGYIITNPVNHRLVNSSYEWKGLNSIQQTLSGENLKTTFVLAGNKKNPKPVENKLTISYLPSFVNLSLEQRKEKLVAFIREREEIIKKEWPEAELSVTERAQNNKKFGDSVKITNQKREKRFFSQSNAAKEKRTVLRERENQYNICSRKYRLGERDVVFPKFTYPPPLHRRPRIKAFVWALSA